MPSLASSQNSRPSLRVRSCFAFCCAPGHQPSMPKSTTPKLNDTQLIILSSAAQREDGFAVLPESVKASAAKAAVTKLLGLGFVKEVRVKRGEPAWRTDEENKPLGLKLTKAGSAALGLAEDGPSEEE